MILKLFKERYLRLRAELVIAFFQLAHYRRVARRLVKIVERFDYEPLFEIARKVEIFVRLIRYGRLSHAVEYRKKPGDNARTA